MNSVVALTFPMPIVHSSPAYYQGSQNYANLIILHESIFYTADTLPPKHCGGELIVPHRVLLSKCTFWPIHFSRFYPDVPTTETSHYILPVLNYKFLVITTFPCL